MHEILLFSMHPSCTPCHRFGIPLFFALFVHCSIGSVTENRFLFEEVQLSLILHSLCTQQHRFGNRKKISVCRCQTEPAEFLKIPLSCLHSTSTQ